MDVRCPACTTEFEFDDFRVTARGVRVKCTDCGHMFTVRKRALAGVKGGTPPPREASGGTARAASGLAASLAAVAPRPRSRIKETRGPAGPSKRTDATVSKAPFLDPTEQRQLSRPWMVRSVNQDVMTFRDISTLQKWIMEGRISRADELSLTGATWRSLGEIAELDSMFRVQRSVEEGRLQSSRPETDDGLTVERDEIPSIDDAPSSVPHPMPPDMDDDDEPETVEFAPPSDDALPSLIPDDPDPHLAGLAAGGTSARQSIAAKWNEANRLPSWTGGPPNSPVQNPQDPGAYASPADLGQITPARAPSVSATGAAFGASAMSSGVWVPPGAVPASATGVPGSAVSGAWSSSLELPVPGLGPRWMSSPAADAFGAFDADTYFDVIDDGPDLFMIGVAVTGIILLGIIVLLLLRGPPARPETVTAQPAAAVNLQPAPVRGGLPDDGQDRRGATGI